MSRPERGFSLIETLIALTIALGLGMSVFQLFRQNEQVFRDEEIINETQQTARLAAFQIADEIRLAGQGVPLYSASFDETPTESTTVILAGSDGSRINFRAGFSNAESEVIAVGAMQLAQGFPTTMTVRDASPFVPHVGRTIYLWGPTAGELWGWVRATLSNVTTSTNTLQVSPSRTIQFSGAPRASLEEAVTIYRDASTDSIRRSSATALNSSGVPTWAPANELATNVTSLTFTYYDETNVSITPTTLSNRNRVRRIGVSLTVTAPLEIRSGSRPSFSVQLNPLSGNLRTH